MQQINASFSDVTAATETSDNVARRSYVLKVFYAFLDINM